MNEKILPVLDEISAVLKKHDMMGLIIVKERCRTCAMTGYSGQRLKHFVGNTTERLAASREWRRTILHQDSTLPPSGRASHRSSGAD